MLHKKRSRCNEKARHHNQRVRPAHRNQSKACAAARTEHSPHPRKEPVKEELKPTQCCAYPSSGLGSGRCRPAFRGNCGVGSELACPPVE